jgi:hypothetical protein
LNQSNSDQPMDKKQLVEKLSELLSPTIDWKKLTRDDLEKLYSAFEPAGPLANALLHRMEPSEREEVIRPFVAGSPSVTEPATNRPSLFGGRGVGILDRIQAAKERPVMGPLLEYIGL